MKTAISVKLALITKAAVVASKVLFSSIPSLALIPPWITTKIPTENERSNSDELFMAYFFVLKGMARGRIGDPLAPLNFRDAAINANS